MADPDNHLSSGLPEDEDARAAAIEERIERLKKLHGWASDTRMVSAEEVKAVVVAIDGEKKAVKADPPRLFLRFSYGGRPEEVVEMVDDHHDIGSGEKAKLRILDASVAARHARISRDGETFRVRDMNTQTGTWVNDERIPLSSPIVDGDVLRCGSVALAVQIVSADAVPAVVEEEAPAPAAEVDESTSFSNAMPASVEEEAPEDAPSGQAAPIGRPALVGDAVACFLVYFDADGNEGEAEVPVDRPLVVGRRSTTDLRLTDHGISSLHAVFEWIDGQVIVRDLGSTNGTWVHGERVPRAVLVDQEVVRLGLVPLRVCYVPAAEEEILEEEAPSEDVAAVEEAATEEAVAEAVEADGATGELGSDEAEGFDEPTEAAVEDGPPNWHLLFVTDAGAVASVTVDERDNCVVVGEAPAEISVQGRGLKPEHLQFDWTDTGLEVMQTRKDAALKVNGKPVAATPLKGGDVVVAGSLVIRVVRAASLTSRDPHSQMFERWARLFRSVDPQLELLFVDPEAAGGRAELTIWGDGAAQLEQHTGAASEKIAATLEPTFLRLLLRAIIDSGFPDLPRGVRARPGGPELNTFWAEERAQAPLSDALTAAAPRWREVRDLLRAVVDHILG